MYELTDEKINIVISKVQDESKLLAKSDDVKKILDIVDEILVEDVDRMIPIDQRRMAIKFASLALCYAAYLEED